MKTLTRQCVWNPDSVRHQGFAACLALTLVTVGAWLLFSAPMLNDGTRAAESGYREGNRNGSGLVSQASIPRAIGQIPMSFTVNQGQTDPRVKFLSQGAGYKLLLSSGEAVLTLNAPSTPHPSPSFNMKLVGDNRNAVVEGLEELPGKSHYFIGNDPKKWRTNVPTYARVKYHEVYPGVDLVYYGNQQELEYDLVVAPRADPGVIKVSFEGADKLELTSNGDLVVSAAGVSTGLMMITSVAPALFTLNQSGFGAAAALDGFTFTGAPFAATRPDGQPNIIALFGTGLGADATDLDANVNVSSSVEVTIDGIPATTLFAGSAPGFTGLNQFNVVLPVGISSGNHTVVVARNGFRSNLVTIAIR